MDFPLLCDQLRMPPLVSASTYGSVGVLPGLDAFLLISCSGFQATAHDAAHHVFMTLPPYPRIEKARRLSWAVARNPAGWALREEMPSYIIHRWLFCTRRQEPDDD
jgi:hypothetical protein